MQSAVMLETPDVRRIMDDRQGDGQLSEPLASLGLELGRVSAEIQSINSSFQAQFLQALTDMQRGLEREFSARLEREVEAGRSELKAQVAKATAEIERITAQIDGITGDVALMIDDPNVELSLVMRKKAEESVLRAYLDGLKFSLGLPR